MQRGVSERRLKNQRKEADLDSHLQNQNLDLIKHSHLTQRPRNMSPLEFQYFSGQSYPFHVPLLATVRQIFILSFAHQCASGMCQLGGFLSWPLDL